MKDFDMTERKDLTASFVSVAKGLNPGEIEVVVSNSATDRQGESIEMGGIDIKQVQRNPVVLWAHDYQSLPIGKIERLWKSNGNLMAKIKFAVDIVPFAETVYKLIMAGVLNAVSIGGIVKEYGVTNGVTDYSVIQKMEMVELSVVPVGAHPDALVTSKGLEKAQISQEEFDLQYKSFVDSAKIDSTIENMIESHIKATKDLVSALESTVGASKEPTEVTATKTVYRKKLVLSNTRQLAKTLRKQTELLIADLNVELKGIHNGTRERTKD